MRIEWILAGSWSMVSCGGAGEPVALGSTSTSTATSTAEGVTGLDDTSTGASIEPGPCAEPLAPVARASARLLAVGARLEDEHGRDVVMRGLNTGGRSKFAPFLPFDVADPDDLELVRAEADVYFGRLVAWGLDTVRMPFSWEALEPAPGRYDLDYLARYRALLDAAEARRLRVIVDFHQDVYASPFCGDGFPPWSVYTPDPPEPSHDCPQWFVGYFGDPGVRESFDRFWSDADGLQGPFMAMWLTMADAVADHPAVVGLEPMNEPGWGTANDLDVFKQRVLQPWFSDVAAELRAAAPGLLVFYDGPGADSTGGGTRFRPEGEGLVYAPHYYDASILLGETWAGTDPAPPLQRMASFGAEASVPVLLGEFGFSHGARGGNDWLTLVMDAVDAQRMSATLWEYSTSAELWNAEDLSVTEADGTERAILDAYVRPWVRAVAGAAIGVEWDATAGELEARWTAALGVTEVVVPSRRFPAGPAVVELEGEGGCYTWDPELGELRVSAPADTPVVLRVR
ncbi:MAG: cellulase family glycosylhydrolase [Myxococcales bacterium]|nr:cellulase family glycosylhydrolase [Myxococcales bacterium]